MHQNKVFNLWLLQRVDPGDSSVGLFGRLKRQAMNCPERTCGGGDSMLVKSDLVLALDIVTMVFYGEFMSVWKNAGISKIYTLLENDKTRV